MTSVSHLQQQIQTAVAKTQTAGVRSIELQRRAGPQCLRLDVVFLMRKIICLSAIREMSKSHLRKGNNMENWEWCFNTIEKCRISKVRGVTCNQHWTGFKVGMAPTCRCSMVPVPSCVEVFWDPVSSAPWLENP